MNHSSIKQTVLSGLFWQMMETIAVNGVQVLIYLMLARLLIPEDFGVVALVVAFVTVSNLLVNSGLGTALIQSKQVDETDYSTVLYFSLFMSCALYLLIFITAPLVAAFYNKPVIVSVLRIYSISIILFAINGVQRSILLRELQFKKMFLVGAIPVFLAGTISIAMAILGFGVFAIVFNNVLLGLFGTIAFWIVMKWKPKLVFSINRLKELFTFSYKLLLANMIETAYASLYPLIIGKAFSTSLLGYYSNGSKIPNLVTSSINASITSVTFPIYSRSQDDKEKLKLMVRQSIIVSNFVIFPIMALLAAVAKPLVTLVLTEKWLPSVPYLQLFCVVYGLHHQHNINLQAISAIGRSDVFLRYQIIKKIIGITLLICTLPFGIIAIVIGQVLTAVISVIINMRPNVMWLNYSVTEQLIDFLPYLSISIIMFGGVHIISMLDFGALITLMLQTIAGVFLYISMAFAFKLKGLQSIIEIISLKNKQFAQ